MHSPSLDGSLHRHDLVFVSRCAWRALSRSRRDLASSPLVAGWVDRGWPLVARRPGTGEDGEPEERQGIALGLPLPPSAGKRRLAIMMRTEDIVRTAPPLALRDAFAAAPLAWQPTLTKLLDAADRHSVTVRVFGGLAWQALTGMDYLTPSSDLDLLVELRTGTDPRVLTAELDAIAGTASMRLDVEFVRFDGAAANWREFRIGTREVLVKTLNDVKLLPLESFAAEGAQA